MLIKKGKIFVPESPLAWCAAVILGGLIVYLLWVAGGITATYYDTFDIWINARQLTGGEGIYYWKRAAFLPFVLSPYFLIERVTGLEGFAPQAARVTAVFFFVFLLCAVYRLFRSVTDRQTALIGLLLLSCHRVVIHTAPFSKEGIPALLFLTLFFYFYWQSIDRPQTGSMVRAGLCLTGAIITRYYFFPLTLIIVLAHELLDGRACRLVLSRPGGWYQSRALQELFFYVLMPGFLLLLIFSVYASLLEPFSLWEAPPIVLRNIRAHTVGNLSREPAFQNYAFWLVSTHWLAIGYFLIGLFVVWFRKHPLRLLMTLWLGVLFFVQTYLAGHKEARYLIPMLPPFCFFGANGLGLIANGLERLAGRWPGWKGRVKDYGKLGFILILLAGPLTVGMRECLHFQDPFYRSTFARDVGRYAKDLSAGQNLFWLGPLYSLHPRDYVFHREDEQFYIYHFHANGLSFYADKVLPDYVGGNTIYSSDLREGLFVQGIGEVASDGDVLVINPERFAYRSKFIPPDLKPIIVEKVREIEFNRRMPKDDRVMYFSPLESQAAVIVTPSPKGDVLVGIGIPLPRVEIMLRAKGSGTAILTDIPVRQGQFTVGLEPDQTGPFDSIVLGGYTHVRLFDPPNM